MRGTATHASQTEPPQLIRPTKPDSRLYKTEDANRSDPVETVETMCSQ